MQIQELIMGFPSHILALALALSLTSLLPTTTALPSPHHPTLNPRASLENVTEFLSDPTHPGTLHCFTTGTYLPKTLLLAPITRICTPDPLNPGITSFSFTPSIDPTMQASFPHQSLELNMDIPMLGRQFAVVDTQLALNSKHATTQECEWALNTIRTECHQWNEGTYGQSADTIVLKGDYYTQGGWWQFQDDGSTYGLDPAFRNKDGTLGDEMACC